MKKLPLYAVGTALVIFAAFRTLMGSLPRLPQEILLFGLSLPKFLWFVFPGLMLVLVVGLILPLKKIPYPDPAVVEALSEDQKGTLAILWKEIRFAAVFLCELAVLFGMKALLVATLRTASGWERANALFIAVLAVFYIVHYSAALRRVSSLPKDSSGEM